MGTNLKPVIRKLDDNEKGLQDFQDELDKKDTKKEKMVLLDYPIVYIHNWKRRGGYEVYIGESNDVIKRTKQHYEKKHDKHNWQYCLNRTPASLYIIGHEHFNKSLTLDVENRLMLYLMGSSSIKKIHNQRGNPQRKYYPDNELDDIFRMVWNHLRKENPELFLKESAIKDSALFKASPLHKLTQEQEKIKEIIIERAFSALEKQETGQIIFIDGEAGTGKTVLNSSSFYEIYLRAEEEGNSSLKCFLVVNQDEQMRVYQQIARKMGLEEKYGKVVCRPTTFIKNHSADHPVDIVFIDEAHLLWTQGKQSYQGKNQLADILERTRVTIVMFDENQILTAEQYWEAQVIDFYRNKAKKDNNYFELKNQMRIAASKETINWIDAFTKECRILKIPQDTMKYEIKIFESPSDLEAAIKKKARMQDYRLSRLIATYDWEYNEKPPAKKWMKKYWEVMIGNWRKPWNRELTRDLKRDEKIKIKDLSWAEQPQTIDEVGSTFTIQGFDLNFAGVILGPSVKYRQGRIIFDPDESYNKKAVQSRKLSDGTRKKFGQDLLRHEVRVLMTRGVNGLYIYAFDDELREALKSADK